MSMPQQTLVRFDVNKAAAGAVSGPLTSGAMVAYVQSLLVAAGWHATEPVEQLVEEVWTCAFDSKGAPFRLAGQLGQPSEDQAELWCAAMISMGRETRFSLFDWIRGRNRADPVADAEAPEAALAILGRAPGIRNVTVVDAF
ncbi:hypothetical protein [Pararhodobacter aggregans]|uniref:Uncharacterized protein n=1 Tax=Pararhodobacter aggregans TaxID=404875 RepID=A0A2T7URR8_9RHOB|nr:hypothetical protein [Pararhodobacter aggregans]PTX00344.1 hypothetical protein C8N33_11050 [Pararhodobacter aggregans]PVE47329.1 hypothetical protein DDE23_10775 [Pararhodobacter aggregans]